MTIPFDQIPNLLRTPGHFIEFDGSMAASGQRMAKLVVLGNMLNTGTALPLTPKKVTSHNAAKTLFGRGSMLAAMFGLLFQQDPLMEIIGIGLEDDPAAEQIINLIQIAISGLNAGTIPLYINGIRMRCAVAADDTALEIATNLAAVIQATPDCELSAVVEMVGADPAVRLHGKNHYEEAKNIQIRFGIYEDEVVPTGLTLTVGSFTVANGNPDITAALAALGDEWFNYIVMPYTDSANLLILETELNRRWGPMVQQDARAFIAKRGTYSTTATFGDGRNNPHVTCMGTNDVPQAPYLWAAANAMVAANALQNHPARPLKTLVLKGLLPPAKEDMWEQTERNLHLFDGISTYTVSSSGEVVIERQITMYQENASGLDDAAFLDINLPETLSRMRWEQRLRSAREYPRHMLADDGDEYPAGLPIVTPNEFKGMLIALYKEFIDAGWAEDLASYKATLIVERDAVDRNRLNYQEQPNVVNQLQVLAGKSQFRV